MLNQQTLEGNWNRIKGKVQEKWGQISDDELESLRGKGDQLVGAIQRKTGEARDQIEKFLDQSVEQGSSAASRTMESARRYGQQAAEQMQRASDQIGDSFSEGYEQAEEYVRDRPGQSLVAAFGLGIVAGLALGLVLRSRH